MRLLRIAWLGIASRRYTEMLLFFRDVLGLDVAFEERDTIEFVLASDDRVQVFAPGHRYHRLIDEDGPMALFEVDALDEALDVLRAAGLELVEEPQEDAHWRWVTFRGPDGTPFQFASRRLDS